MQIKQSLLESREEENLSSKAYLIEHLKVADEKVYLQLLEHFVTARQAKERYQWLYKNNPQGKAETWLARERVKGTIVGFTSIYARNFLVEGKPTSAGIGFDAFVRPDHRRRGIALELHRASLKSMLSGEVDFKFMCGPPTPANLDALVKAGSQIIGSFRYVSIPFTTRGLMAMLHCPKTYAEKLVSYGTPIDKLLGQLRRLLNSDTINTTVQVVERTDHRFDQLWNKLAPNFTIIGQRDREYLEWRYIQNPVCSQKLVSIENKGELLGWAVLEFASKGCLLVDYLLPLEQKVAQEALSALVNFVAIQNTPRLTLRFNLKGLYAGLFRTHGFLPGWTLEYFQTLCSEKSLEGVLLKQNNWHFTNGDLNPEASPWSINTAPESLLIDTSHPWAVSGNVNSSVSSSQSM